MKKVGVLGDGAWGTAIASVLADNGFQVTLWCNDNEAAYQIQHARENKKYLPGITLASSVQATTDLSQVFGDVQWVFEAIPVKHLRTILNRAAAHYHNQQMWVLLSKGIEQQSLLFPSQIVDEVFKTDVQKVVISGPSFAYDLARKQQTAVDFACPNALAVSLKQIMENNYFHLHHTQDLIGVQVGGAFKNVIALVMGMLNAAGYGDNSQAWIMTQALKEMQMLATKMGGNAQTLNGLSGIGDLMLTAYGRHSKNRNYGAAMIKMELYQGNEPEAINTSKAIDLLIERYSLNLPLFSAIVQVIQRAKPLDYIFEVMATDSGT